MFDEARLLSPGTLVEEAALRRSIALGFGDQGFGAHFCSSCSQYVRRFLQSPYASQFADAFVAGVVALHKTIELAAIEEIVAGMEPEQQKVIYLRLARRAAIDGHSQSSPNMPPPRPTQSRSMASYPGTIRAPCSIPALPPSRPTRSTRRLPS